MGYYIYEGRVYDEDQLEHFGIKGMKWGKHKKKLQKLATNALDSVMDAGNKVARKVDDAASVVAKNASKTYNSIKKSDFYKKYVDSEGKVTAYKPSKTTKKIQNNIKKSQYHSPYANSNGKNTVPQAKTRKTYKTPYTNSSGASSIPTGGTKNHQYSTPYSGTNGKASVPTSRNKKPTAVPSYATPKAIANRKKKR